MSTLTQPEPEIASTPSWRSQAAEKLNSRKLWVTVLGLAVASVLVWFERIDSVAWSTAFLVTVGGYLGAQTVLDKHANTIPDDRTGPAFRSDGGSQ